MGTTILRPSVTVSGGGWNQTNVLYIDDVVTDPTAGSPGDDGGQNCNAIDTDDYLTATWGFPNTYSLPVGEYISQIRIRAYNNGYQYPGNGTMDINISGCSPVSLYWGSSAWRYATWTDSHFGTSLTESNIDAITVSIATADIPKTGICTVYAMYIEISYTTHNRY